MTIAAQIEAITGKPVRIGFWLSTSAPRDGMHASFIDDEGNSIGFVGDTREAACAGLLAHVLASPSHSNSKEQVA